MGQMGPALHVISHNVIVKNTSSFELDTLTVGYLLYPAQN